MESAFSLEWSGYKSARVDFIAVIVFTCGGTRYGEIGCVNEFSDTTYNIYYRFKLLGNTHDVDMDAIPHWVAKVRFQIIIMSANI